MFFSLFHVVTVIRLNSFVIVAALTGSVNKHKVIDFSREIPYKIGFSVFLQFLVFTSMPTFHNYGCESINLFIAIAARIR